jgi:hypothetical protein
MWNINRYVHMLTSHLYADISVCDIASSVAPEALCFLCDISSTLDAVLFNVMAHGAVSTRAHPVMALHHVDARLYEWWLNCSRCCSLM